MKIRLNKTALFYTGTTFALIALGIYVHWAFFLAFALFGIVEIEEDD